MASTQPFKGLAKDRARRIAFCVVGHDCLHRATALRLKPASGPSERPRDVDRVLGTVQLAIGQAGVVIDHTDHRRSCLPGGSLSALSACRWPSAREQRTLGSGRRRCARAPRPLTTHSGGCSGACLNDACASSRCDEAPSRSSSDESPSDTSSASAPSWSSHALRGSPAPALQRVPRDSSEALVDESSGSSCRHAALQMLRASDATSGAQSPARPPEPQQPPSTMSLAQRA